jgi:hypothetical protein
MTGHWDRPPLRHHLEWRAYDHTIGSHTTPGERYKIVEARLLYFRSR